LYGKINAANPLAAFIQEVKTMIEIVPYKPSWPVEFVQIASQLRSALGELALRIDHIGSTSVPGLDAKDIIDIQLTVSSFDDFQPVQSALEGIGFTLNPDYVRDHRPPGAQGPASDWEKRYFHPSRGQRPIHLHVRAAGRPNQLYPLLFRDYLRAHPAAAAGYAALKRALARFHGNSDDHTPYVEIKDPVCDIIMAAAYEWAEQVGWQPGPSDA
jgi:GrpB-like predicted nucleotidyltransferase (UPF0157 family)